MKYKETTRFINLRQSYNSRKIVKRHQINLIFFRIVATIFASVNQMVQTIV